MCATGLVLILSELKHPVAQAHIYLPSSVNLVQYFLIFKKKSSSYIILVIHDIEAHKMLHHATYVCKYVLINNMYVHNNNYNKNNHCEKSEPPTRTNGAHCLYVYMYVCIYVCIILYVCMYLSGVRIRQPVTRSLAESAIIRLHSAT